HCMTVSLTWLSRIYCYRGLTCWITSASARAFLTPTQIQRMRNNVLSTC
ncbi:taurine ABC superfamily ATP binding cassette transporter, ABC protein, partial [Vibrio parahaemolyticus V-223/04]